MNYKYILASVFLFIKGLSGYEWAVIGAGPAGITTIGVLLDLGVPEDQIAWVDPEFKVGRLPIYNNVPANNPTAKFIAFIQSCDTFKKCKSKEIEHLFKVNPNDHHELDIITKPLQCISNQLRTRVFSLESKMHYLFFENDMWNILTTNNKILQAHNVVLATGSRPKELDVHKEGTVIPLDVALNKYQLKQVVKKNDTVAVIGSAHSAILILKFLCDLNIKKIYNFYNKQLLVNSNSGTAINPLLDLYGLAAHWVKEVLAIKPPENLERIQSTPEALNKILPTCTKTIYAIGYKPNELPNIKEAPTYQQDINGTIGPRLFGIGIAFPETIINEAGNLEPQVGLKAFLDYAQKKLPEWVNSHNSEKVRFLKQQQYSILNNLNDIFRINLL